eukprot:jgi/Mesvir1/11375/Mv10275-RA.1
MNEDKREEEVMAVITKATLSPKAGGFSIPLSTTWEWLGYANRSEASATAKRVLQRGLEFVKIKVRDGADSDIWLNKEGFKNLAMASNTETGRRARWYFLAVERTLHEIAQEETIQRVMTAISASKDLEDRVRRMEERLASVL